MSDAIAGMIADDGGAHPVPTVGGCTLMARMDGDSITLTDENGREATVTIADVIVVISMFAAAYADNLGFFRVLRALRLFRSYHILGMLRRDWPWVRRHEEMLLAMVNLGVFLFITTAIVFVSQHHINPEIQNYVDALYFTVTTLTTTGFGDITLQGEWGRLLAVLIMILGISLFLRLLQTIFRPAKVKAVCDNCGLSRHDPDAVHCKHCGEVVHIPTSGIE